MIKIGLNKLNFYLNKFRFDFFTRNAIVRFDFFTKNIFVCFDFFTIFAIVFLCSEQKCILKDT